MVLFKDQKTFTLNLIFIYTTFTLAVGIYMCSHSCYTTGYVEGTWHLATYPPGDICWKKRVIWSSVLFVNTFSIPASSPTQGRGCLLGASPSCWGWRQGDKWPVHHRATQSQTLTFTFTVNFEFPIDLTRVFGGESWRTKREPAQTQGEHANSTQKCARLGITPMTMSCEMGMLTFAQLCSPNK